MQSSDMGVGADRSVGPTASVLHPIASVLDLTDIPESGVRDYFLYHPYDGQLENVYVSVPAAGTFTGFSIQIIQKRGNTVVAEAAEQNIGSITTDPITLSLPSSLGEGGVFARVRYGGGGGGGGDVDDGTYTKPLDTYTGAEVAYGVRLLRTDYTGGCMSVRADGGSTIDIGFDSNGHLDQDAIVAHCGSADGFVATLYDQSGDGHDLTQSTNANQPQIYDGATRSVLKVNGKPSIRFDDTPTYLIQGTQPIINTSGGYLFSVIGVNPDATNQAFGVLGSNSNVVVAGLARDGNTGANQIGMSVGAYHVNGSQIVSSNQQKLYDAILTQGVVHIANYGNTSGVNRNYWPTYPHLTFYRNAQLQEFVAYHTDQSSNQSAIESNMNVYYGVYGGEDGVSLDPPAAEPTKMFLTLHVRTNEIT